MKTKIFEIPIYGSEVLVLLGDKSELKDTLVNDYSVQEEYAIDVYDHIKNNHGLFNTIMTCNGSKYLIWLPDVPKSVYEYGVLIHELQHYVFYLLGDKGMKHTTDSDEAYSYLLQYLFGEIDMWIQNLKAEEEQNTNN